MYNYINPCYHIEAFQQYQGIEKAEYKHDTS